MPDAIVLPIIFGMKHWEKHSRLLRFFVKKGDFVIGRNPMGAAIGLNYFDNVIYDGRSSLKGEISEYDMALNTDLNQSMIKAEKRVVNSAKLRLAVSNSLVQFWKDDLGYQGRDELVIHCSLGNSHSKKLVEREVNRNVKLVFSGGGSPWQSQKEKYDWIASILRNQQAEIVFLTKTDEHIERLKIAFPDQVTQKWLNPDEVYNELCKADYGILLRESNLTNQVAAPVKFAEYLNAGLKVIISASVKDYAKFVKEHNCGIVIESLSKPSPVLKPLLESEREYNSAIAEQYFSKDSPIIQSQYQKVIDFIDEH